ncbi:MAG TPA: malto-oligosyltrehalose trehalohydrolase [Planctomycetaceae bacterium]|nr:malto-oligosyltrehalose trehalohydrolase [Planctomycetaceae bacterium]
MSRSQIDSPRKAAGNARHGLLVDRTRAVGAEILPGKGVSFRVWAPKRRTVEVVLWRELPQNDWQSAEPLLRLPLQLETEGDGYFSALVPDAAADMYYGLCLDGGPRVFPDPASRFQPRGPIGPSQVNDPRAFGWTDSTWKGLTIEDQVIYEMHVGTLTHEGTWRAAQERLPDLVDLGITVVETMPVAEFPGNFGWSYDGVCLFAPTRHYGRPDDFRQFVDRAHALGLGVILDVVYNHFGTVDCTVSEYSDDYNSRRYKNEWGAPVNFDGERSGPVREFFLANVRYWIEEFHLDGFRFDATQSIFDASAVHILTAMQQEAHEAAGERGVILLAENEPQDIRLLRPVDKGGHGLDASCNDDFHHTARVRLTGLTEAYYEDYRGSVDELRSCLLGGYLFQGQMYLHQGKRRGTPTRGLPPTAFIHFLQNHDQIANTGPGRRIHELTSPGRLRAMTALWLLSPQTPMIFQGQEFCASTPFLYFADFTGENAQAVSTGREKFLSQFPSLDTDEARRALPDPADISTFERSRLDWSERERHHEWYDLHRDLLKLRRNDPIFARQRADLLEAAALGRNCLAVRYLDEPGAANSDRLLIVNFGQQLSYWPCPQPLLAPPAGQSWELLWSSESVRYCGRSTPPVETEKGWQIPAEAAVVLGATADLEPPKKAPQA